MMQLSPSKPVPKKVEECIAHMVGIKMQQSNLPNKTVQLPSGSSQPLTITPIRIPRKSSDETCERNVRYRANTAKELIHLMSGEETQSVTKQTMALLNSMEESDRNTIIKNLGTEVIIPANHITAMKSNLNIPWNQLREIHVG
ncbi:uncharacterized protein LOC130624966 [Hydractinia symbiolongicarpus]|uniref:uncharacterized protein LOC130624966 n=1 Tax=Hydractinia symbiolongicarpus TaxID=13093 RepID=UPI00254EB07B|nr:uncharacterized protein LOC130624966 [Hydractinia symbiolongicarpus]